MRKYFINIFTALIIVILLFPACSTISNVEENAAEKALPTLKVTAFKVDTEKFDGEMIAKALDDYASALVGAHIDLQYVEHERYDQVFNKYAVSDSLPDVFFLLSKDLANTLQKSGDLMPLDALIEDYGQGIIDSVDPDFLKVYLQGGITYAVPTVRDMARSMSFEYRVSIAEEYGIDMSSIKNYTDLTGVFSHLVDSNADIIPISSHNFTSWDPMGDELGVLLNYGQDTTVVNLYETAEYEEYCRTISEWSHEKFLLDTDASTVAINNFVRTPEIFGKRAGYWPGLPYVDSVDADDVIACAQFSDPYLYWDDLKRYAWGISSDCEHPEAAMKFLNLMYSDPYVINLLAYGIEGVHYEIIDEKNGIIDFPPGVDVNTSGYAQFRGMQYGNLLIGYAWNGYPADVWEQTREFNNNAKRSMAFGFDYDKSPVTDEVYRCEKVVNEYACILDAGAGNASDILARFRSELKTAGIDKIVAEKQRQLDAWLSDRGES